MQSTLGISFDSSKGSISFFPLSSTPPTSSSSESSFFSPSSPSPASYSSLFGATNTLASSSLSILI